METVDAESRLASVPLAFLQRLGRYNPLTARRRPGAMSSIIVLPAPWYSTDLSLLRICSAEGWPPRLFPVSCYLVERDSGPCTCWVLTAASTHCVWRAFIAALFFCDMYRAIVVSRVCLCRPRPRPPKHPRSRRLPRR